MTCPSCICSSSIIACCACSLACRLVLNTVGITAKACFFQLLIWVACTPYSAANSLRVLFSLMASTAILLLNSEPPRLYQGVDYLSQAALSDSVRLS